MTRYVVVDGSGKNTLSMEAESAQVAADAAAVKWGSVHPTALYVFLQEDARRFDVDRPTTHPA